MANCIGHFNYAYFVRFLTFVVLSCSYHLAMLSWRIWDFAQGGEDTYLNPFTTFDIVMTVLNFTACIPVEISIIFFCIYHYWSLLSNTTTIESWEKDKVATLIRRGKIRDIKYPYSISPLFNISSVMGSSPLLWCWPSNESSTRGDGTRFAIVDGSDQYTSLSWPPQDPAYPLRGHRLPPRTTDPDAAFTYGGRQFNPALVPSSAALRQRKNPPWGPQDGTRWSSDEDSGSDGYEGEGNEGEEDLGPRAGVRVRRGSEGIEVRQASPWTAGLTARELEIEHAVRAFEARRARSDDALGAD